MEIKEHIDKAQRFINQLGKMNYKEDAESILWGRMHITSNWLCAVLHAMNLTPPEIDLAHSWFIADYEKRTEFEQKLTPELIRAFQTVVVFEDTRTICARGPSPYTQNILQFSDKDYVFLKELTEKVTGYKINIILEG